jgi:Uma2 family endonuclease
MTTLLKLTPADQGRPLTLEEFLCGEYAPGFKYELIDGRLDVSPEARLPHDQNKEWLQGELFLYSRRHPEVINYVSGAPRAFVPGATRTTCPEPDLAAYHDFPRHEDYDDHDWQDFSPVLVVEILSEGTEEKDLTRNVRLYRRVPSIREYWVIDPRPVSHQPTLIVYRRSGTRWRVLRVPFGDTYRTRLLPDFELIIDPRR